MGSSVLQWETDPLFSAAEVIQDSADRMQSIFRLLLHEQSLVQVDHSDPRLLTSLEYHKRDLATILETAKWQLEDFERVVNSSAVADKSEIWQDVVSRRRKFIQAIREQINDVEKCLEDPLVRDSLRNSEWVNLNEQDRDGLALFLSGGNTSACNINDSEDSSMLRRLPAPTAASSLKDGTEDIIEHRGKQDQSLSMREVVHTGNEFESAKNNGLRKVESSSLLGVGLEAPGLLNKNDHNGQVEETWDLEAKEAKPNGAFHETSNSQTNISNILNNLWTAYGSKAARNYTKRMKDGEEQRQPSLYREVSHLAQVKHMDLRLASRCGWFQRLYIAVLTKIVLLYGWCRMCRARYQRSTYCVQENWHHIHLILTILFTVIILGITVYQFA